MKRFIINLSIFICTATTIYISALLVMGRYASSNYKPNIKYRIGSYGHMHSRLSEIKDYNNVDILFLGSSHAYRGFDTRIFKEQKYSTFNLGSSSQTPLQTKVLLERYLRIIKPKTIIYEVYPGTLVTDGVESSLDIISNDKSDLHSIKMALTINNIKVYNTLVYGFTLNNLLRRNETYVETKEKKLDKYISGGYVEKELSFYKPKVFSKRKISLRSNQLESFNEIVEMIKNNNIELILVFAPISKVQYDSYTNISYYDSLMSSYSKYYNFNKIVELNDSLHFYDSHHLNQDGVDIFNNKLLDILK